MKHKIFEDSAGFCTIRIWSEDDCTYHTEHGPAIFVGEESLRDYMSSLMEAYQEYMMQREENKLPK